MSTADARGWGPGWPTDRSADMAWARAPSGAKWLVHKKVAAIVQAAVVEIERRGYKFDHGPADTDDDWGYANRPIRGTNRPSNHSWGLAIDIDAQEYPMGQSARRPPQWVVDTFYRYGFTWGGRWARPDPMHFEFLGTPTDADRIRNSLGGQPPPPPPTSGSPVPTTIRLQAVMFQEDDVVFFTKNPYNPTEIYICNGFAKRHVRHPATIDVVKFAALLQGVNPAGLGPGEKPITREAFDEMPTVV